MKVNRFLRVLLLGYPTFIYMLAPMLSTKDIKFEPFGGGRLLSWVPLLSRVDACYFIGGIWKDKRFLKFARFFRKPVVVHWVGTDVVMAGKAYEMGNVSPVVINANHNWAEVPWIALELRTLGILAEIVPLTSPLTASSVVKPLPQRFTVLTYFLDTRPTFYGAHHILRLAKEMPDIRVMCVGFEKPPFRFTDEPLPPNIELLGRPESLDQVYKDTTVLVRLTEHDGLSFMILEALSHGRYCVWSYPLDEAPGAFVAMNYETLREHIQVLYDKHARGCLLPNYDGAVFVRHRYNPEHIAKEIHGRFQLLLRQ